MSFGCWVGRPWWGWGWGWGWALERIVVVVVVELVATSGVGTSFVGEAVVVPVGLAVPVFLLSWELELT